MRPASLRIPRPPRAAWLLAAAMLLNELLRNVDALADGFGSAKVMRSLSDELDRLAWSLAGDLAAMLALTALAMLLAAWAWVAVCRVVAADVARRFGTSRAVRWAFGFTAGLAFVNAWYSAHTLLLPGTRQVFSWLVMLSGALAGRPSEGRAQLVAPLLATAVVCLFTLHALRRSDALRRRFAAGAVAAVLVFGGWAWWRAPGEARPFTREGNIVLLGLDSLQMNRLAAGGSPRGLTPSIDGFLAESFRFDNAWTPLARTYPSWLSILTGREPQRHGARFNLASDARLDPGNAYLPARLAAAGWSTLHATDEVRFSIMRPGFGFERLVHPEMGARDFLLAGFFDFSAANLLRRSRLGYDLFPALSGNRASVGYGPSFWVQDVIAAIDELPRDRPALLVMHLCGNHWPFESPAPYAHAGADPVDGCLRMIDDQAGAILARLREVGLLERSTVALLSDHGDGWSGDPADDTNSHGDDFRSAFANRIVLGLRAPGLAPGVSTELVRSFDLYPTLLEAAGLGFDPEAIDGRSLAPFLARAEDAPGERDRRAAREPPRELFAETGLDRKVYTAMQLVERNALWYRIDPASGLVFLREEGFEEFLPLKWHMLVTQEWRLVAVPYARRFELHPLDPATGLDLPEDGPAARRALAAAPPALRAELLSRLAGHFGLDAAALRADAAERGFLPRELARAR